MWRARGEGGSPAGDLVSYVSVVRPPQVDVLRRAEVRGQWETVEVGAELTVIDRNHVEEQKEKEEKAERSRQADPDEADLLLTLVLAKRDEGEQCIREEEPKDEAKQVGEVVNPGEEPNYEETNDDG